MKKENFYLKNFDKKYYEFDKYQLDIDPAETFESIDEYSREKQLEEIRKCHVSFPYFCQKYVKIARPTQGLLNFILYKYQHRVIREYGNQRFVILSKFRQGGLTTVTVLWSLWRCLFKLDETIMVVSKSDREAIAAGEIVKRALEELPKWLKPDMSKNNDHEKIFMETGCKLLFYTVEAVRGRSFSFLIIDEAAFIPNMDSHWKALYPTIATGGKCMVISTVNGVGNWYYDIYQNAKKKLNDFSIIDLDYWEHPDYDNKDWVKQTRNNIGERGWQQEVLRDFLGSGETYIPPNILNELSESVRDIRPTRILFPDWNNLEEAKSVRFEDLDSWEKGALHIFKEPLEGREYIMGVDTAEGVGQDGDNSCFEVIDAITCEQIAEFYSNIISPNLFAQIIAQIATFYNHATVVVECIGTGLSVIDKLKHDYNYENIYSETGGKPGLRTTKSNRPLFLEKIQNRLLTKTIMIRSQRIVGELKTFVYNMNTKRAQASKGNHDDAIMAMAMALFVRDNIRQDMPAGMTMTPEMSSSFKNEIYEEIKKELKRGAPENWIFKDDFADTEEIDEDEIQPPPFYVRRNNGTIMTEFGW